MDGGLVIYVRKMNIFYLTLAYFFVTNVHKMNNLRVEHDQNSWNRRIW
jgi:hypothetical protein